MIKKLTKGQIKVQNLMTANFVPVTVSSLILNEGHYRSPLITRMVCHLFKEGYCRPVICNEDYFVTADKAVVIQNILKKANIEFYTGNDAPRGGQSGYYICINVWGKQAFIGIQREYQLDLIFSD